MATGETQNRPYLYELTYPNDLREDEAAITYVDAEGYTYMEPASGQAHDFDVSAALTTVGLSSAEVVAVGPDERPMLRYSPGADLLPLPSLLNAAIDRQEGRGDIVSGLQQVAKLLILAETRCRFVPQGLTRQGIAIDRGLGRAEFLAPYIRAEDGAHWQQAFGELQADIISAGLPSQRPAIEQFFSEALLRLHPGEQ